MRLTPLALLLAAAPAAAAPSTIAHQGRLLDASGAAISGTHALTFSLYDAESGGALKWSEAHPAVQVTDGFYAVILGQLDPLDFDAVSGARWLEVSGASVGTLARSPLGAVPWALQATGVALVPEAAGTGARACGTGEIGRLRFNTDTNGLELCRAAAGGGGTWSGLVVANQIVGNDSTGRQYADGTFARSCREYRDSPQYTVANGDGVYWIQPTGWAPVKAYCDMTTDNGGWTRVYREFHTGQEDGPYNAEMNSTWGDPINGEGGLNPVDIYDRIGAVDVLYDLQTHWLKTPQVSKANFAWLWPDSAATDSTRVMSSGAVLSSGQSWPTVYHHVWVGGQMEISTNTTWDSAVILDSGTDANHGWAIWTAANGVYKRNGGYQTPADLWVEIYLR